MRAEVSGKKNNIKVKYCSTLVHDNTAVAAGYGTGSVAQLVLVGKLHKPGIFPVEQGLPTHLFEEAMASRGIEIHQTIRSLA
jgi:saccharopine dehydrogenase-like NADP-dependent oxidoreductase